jgi:hypothetical protein
VLATEDIARRALTLVIDLGQDQAHRAAGRRDRLIEAGDGLHHGTVERARNDHDFADAIAGAGDVMLNKLPEPLLLLLVP